MDELMVNWLCGAMLGHVGLGSAMLAISNSRTFTGELGSLDDSDRT